MIKALRIVPHTPRTVKKHNLKHGHAKRGRFTVEYNSWRHMKDRCLNPSENSYKNYGGRGISICDRWMDFENFLSDMGLKPSRKHTIERRNNDGNYEPSNCHWATRLTQGNNTRRNARYSHGGLTLTVSQWARLLGVPYRTLRDRFKRKGWTTEMAIKLPIKRPARIEAAGQSLTISEWATRNGIKKELIRHRLAAGYDPDDAVNAPKFKIRTFSFYRR